MKVLILAILGLELAHTLSYPGTETRPILSKSEASNYTKENYFAGWQPEEIIIPENPDYVVQQGQSIQAVVNKAIEQGNPAYRTYIKIEPGRYMETVYIKSNIPLTIYGSGKSAEDVHIMATLSAKTSTSDYIATVNPNGERYKEGEPAWGLYNSCATKHGGVIGTNCTAVVWVESDNFQLQGVTVHNGATDAQAVALRTAADKIHLMGNNFKSYQDTLALGIDSADSLKTERVMVHMCYIEGQIDYVFGAASAVFDMTTFYTVATNKTASAIILAPDTPPERSYGFLVINSIITGDSSYRNKVKLARSWDHGVASADLYTPGVSANGQLVVRDSNIDSVIDVLAPYGAAATSHREFTTDINVDRDLNDNNHNRLWEFNNSGDGA
ncbi:unnamed protein product [Ceutorhynchus assimilis]|uniref:pectinesterase n=1 Tax=Ceutorhynchus assimilis TaxID=467358 RepID=A0A9N9MQ27_9CUCU|nr:unnamed protein product [Ceutorhynchus assimilis]